MKHLDLTLAALKRLPAIAAAEKLSQEERKTRRATLIDGVRKTSDELQRREAELMSKAAPIERKLSALREEIAELEEKLAPLAQARMSSIVFTDGTLTRLQGELRADALEEVEAFLSLIDQTRNSAVLNDFEKKRAQVLGSFQFDPSDPSRRFVSDADKIPSAAAQLLNAYREAERIALEESDVTGAIEGIREKLLAIGIRLPPGPQ